MKKEIQDLHQILYPTVPSGSADVLVFSENSSARLIYTTGFIFTRVLGLNYTLSTNLSDAKDFSGPVINYSVLEIPGSFQIQPHALLFEKGVRQAKPEILFRNGLNCAYTFPSEEGSGSLGFDLFSMVFFFISRYEEWQNYEADEHGRFGIHHSLLYKHHLHLSPIIDLCLEDFRSRLMLHFRTLSLPARKAELISTVDVDNLFAYQHKGLVRTVGSMAKDLLHADFFNLIRRRKVLKRQIRDPFDIYEAVADFCKNEEIPLIYFFLMKSGTKFDRSVQPKSPAFKLVIDSLRNYPAGIGLHPSYYSSVQPELLDKELDLLKKVLGRQVFSSRQHFLRFTIRNTPGLLAARGIKADFSMGYSNAAGFRAGTGFPFYYYDFEQEAAQDILLVPFCLMDGAYSIHQKTEADKILETVGAMSEKVKNSRGLFVSVFHERSFDDHLYPGFGSLYREIHLRLKEKFRS